MPELSTPEPASLKFWAANTTKDREEALAVIREYSAARSVDAIYASTSDQWLVWVGCAC
jgi:hypothetical protein